MKYNKTTLHIVLLSDLWTSNSFVRGKSIEILLYLAASEKLSGLNKKNRRYMLLASERREYQYILNEGQRSYSINL